MIPPPGPSGRPIFNEPPPQYNIYDVPRHVVSAGETAASSRPRVIHFFEDNKIANYSMNEEVSKLQLCWDNFVKWFERDRDMLPYCSFRRLLLDHLINE